MAEPVAAAGRAAAPDGDRPARVAAPRRLPPARHLAAVAAGGALGGTLRYALVATFPVDRSAFPWVILLENLTGAFLLGLLATTLMERARVGPELRPFLATGVLASFTTFSNLTLDVALLHGGGASALALGYAAASVVLGLAAAALGLALGRGRRSGGRGAGLDPGRRAGSTARRGARLDPRGDR